MNPDIERKKISEAELLSYLDVDGHTLQGRDRMELKINASDIRWWFWAVTLGFTRATWW